MGFLVSPRLLGVVEQRVELVDYSQVATWVRVRSIAGRRHYIAKSDTRVDSRHMFAKGNKCRARRRRSRASS